MTTEILLSLLYVLLLAATFLVIGRSTIAPRERLPLRSAADVAATIRRGLWTVSDAGQAHTYPVPAPRSVTPAA